MQKIKRALISLVLLLVAVLLPGCASEEDYDEVVGIDVCASFYSEEFIQGDDVSLDDYTVLITFESSITKEFLLSKIAKGKIDTNTTGVKFLTLKYLNKSVKIRYEVVPIEVYSITYKGTRLTLYKGENANIDNVEISVLYNNGAESTVVVAETSHSDIDNLELGVEKAITVTYSGKVTSIPYIVTCRPIEENITYGLIDNTTLYNGDYSVLLNGNVLNFYKEEGGVPELVSTMKLEEFQNNQYISSTTKYIHGKAVKILVYRVNDKIILEVNEE